MKMYLHLGQSEVVPSRTIIGIFDLDITSQSKLTRGFLKGAQQSDRVVNVSEELPKSFVVCEEKGVSKVYLSQLSSATLLKRAATNMTE